MNDDGYGFFCAPSIDVSYGNPYVVWHEMRFISSSPTRVYLIKFDQSSDEGNSFGNDVGIVQGDPITKPRWWPDICVADHANIEVVWQDHRTGLAQIWHARSRDFGSSFQDHTRIDDAGINYYPSMALLGGRPHVVWQYPLPSGMIYQDYRRNYHANQWGDDVSVIAWLPGYNPAIATYSNIHIVWDDGDDSIYHCKSTDGGNTFGPKTKVSGQELRILCGDISDDDGGPLTAGTYRVVDDVSVPSGQQLTIHAGVKIYFESDHKIITEENTTLRAKASSSDPIYLISYEAQPDSSGMKLTGDMVLKNGGELKPGP